MSREDQYSVTVAIDGEDFGVWDKLEGFEVDSEELKYKPGGMAPHVSLGGSSTVENGTVSRLYDLARDHQVVHAMMSKVGKAIAVVTKQPLDIDGNAFGRPIVYSGKLKRVSPPNADSESNDAAMLEIEVSPAGAIG